ncbi:p-cresol methylhydroxylase [Pseudomonas sp. C9]|nr:p-cresol methylhydroxylase [Pseudomonas sp. C9]
MPGTASLAAKYGGSLPAALEERTDMPPAFIKYFVRNGVLIMPAFRKTEITDADLELLVDYLKAKDQ